MTFRHRLATLDDLPTIVPDTTVRAALQQLTWSGLDGLPVTVDGAIGGIVTRVEERRARLRRAVVGIASAALLGSIVWITGVWMFSRHLLPVDLERAIESLRSLWT